MAWLAMRSTKTGAISFCNHHYFTAHNTLDQFRKVVFCITDIEHHHRFSPEELFIANIVQVLSIRKGRWPVHLI